MSKLPNINGTNKKIVFINEQEDYNFTNKEKKRKDSAKNDVSPLQMIQDLKQKIQQQKNQIENRNATIKGLQRNFQSISAIVKNQKVTSAALRAELETLRENSDTGHQRATKMHQQLLQSQKQRKLLKEEITKLKKAVSQCQQHVDTIQQLKRRAKDAQSRLEKTMIKYNKAQQERMVLQKQVQGYKTLQKEKRSLNERVIDLQQEVRKIADINNSFKAKKQIMEDEILRLKIDKEKSDAMVEEKNFKLKDFQRKNQNLQQQIAVLKRQIDEKAHQAQKIKSNLNQKQMFTKLKMQDQQKQKHRSRELQNLLQNERKNNAQLICSIKQLNKEINLKNSMIQTGHKQVQCLRLQNQSLLRQKITKQKQYLKEIESLTISMNELSKKFNLTVGDNFILNKKLLEESERLITTQSSLEGLNRNLQSMNGRLQLYEGKFGTYIKQIQRILPASVIILPQDQFHRMQEDSGSVMQQLKDKQRVLEGQLQIASRKLQQKQQQFKKVKQEQQIMKGYIQNLESQVNQKSKQITELKKSLEQYRDEQQSLAKLISDEKLKQQQLRRKNEQQKIKSQKIIEQEREKSKRQFEQEREKSKRQLQAQRQRLAKIQEQKQRTKKLLVKYQQQQENLKSLINNEKEQSQRIARQKQEQIQRLMRQKQQEIQKERQNNKLLWTDNKKLKQMEDMLRQQARKQIQARQRQKQEQLDRVKKELQSKYRRELTEVKDKNNIDESNSKELKKLLLDKANQIKSLTEKHDKLNSEIQFYKNRNKQLQGVVSRLQKKHRQNLIDLERENKSGKEVISVFQGKLKVYEQKEKQWKANNKRLTDQLDALRHKFASMKIQEKMIIIQRSLEDMQTSLKTLQNTLSCNYCMQVVKECVRVSQCGHIYCKKCKAGYEPNCGQCKKKGNILNDKMIDQSVSKADYMRIILGAVKDDIAKISLRQ